MKTTAKKTTAKKRPAKRAVKKNSIVGKLLDLKYRINDHYKSVGGKITTKEDKLWVMGQISALREGARLDRHQMKYANEMWSKYEG